MHYTCVVDPGPRALDRNRFVLKNSPFCSVTRQHTNAVIPVYSYSCQTCQPRTRELSHLVRAARATVQRRMRELPPCRRRAMPNRARPASAPLPDAITQSTPPSPVPSRVEPTRVELTRVEPSRVEPERVEPTRVEPTSVEPASTMPMSAMAMQGCAALPPQHGNVSEAMRGWEARLTARIRARCARWGGGGQSNLKASTSPLGLARGWSGWLRHPARRAGAE